MVIDDNVCKMLFFNGELVLGEVILLGMVLVCIVGVMVKKESVFGNDEFNSIWLFYMMVMSWFIG